MKTTDGTLLGGSVRYTQPAESFRSGLEPVLLAATVPAKPGERVLEAGSGAGAGLLCLAARVPLVLGLGVEIDPALVALAGTNAAANGFARLDFRTADITQAADIGLFEHAFANPPYHAASGTQSPQAGRARAKTASAGLFGLWISSLGKHLRPGGTLSLILPAHAIPECLDALRTSQCGSVSLFPLWPRAGREAKLVILRAIRHGRSAMRLLPGLELHEGAGFTKMAQDILRHGAALRIV